VFGGALFDFFPTLKLEKINGVEQSSFIETQVSKNINYQIEFYFIWSTSEQLNTGDAMVVEKTILCKPTCKI